jgi:hypothetical protein
MSKAYTVASGYILRGDEKIAAYDQQTGIVDFLPGKANYRAPVVGFLRKASLPVEVAPESPVEKEPLRARKVGSAAPVADAVPAVDVAPELPGGEAGAPQARPEPAVFAPVAATAKQAKPNYNGTLTPDGWV